MRAARVALGVLGLVLFPGVAAVAVTLAARDRLIELLERSHPQLDIEIASDAASWWRAAFQEGE